MIVVWSATASRTTSSGGSAASAASMVAAEMSVTGNSRPPRRDLDQDGVRATSADRTSVKYRSR
jgi:hypothetical protein